MNLPSDDLVALSQRLWESFAGRCVRRFLLMSWIDRCIVLASQALTALIPLLILVTTLVPSGQENVLANTVITKFGCQVTPPPPSSSSSSPRERLEQRERLQRPPRVLGRLVHAAPADDVPDRLGTGQDGSAQQLLRCPRTRRAPRRVHAHLHHSDPGPRLPGDWLWMLPLSAITGLVIWTSIPYLLMHRQVHWRRLLAAGAISSAGIAVFGVATTIYMPPLIARYSNEFGLFGITIALLGWLLSAWPSSCRAPPSGPSLSTHPASPGLSGSRRGAGSRPPPGTSSSAAGGDQEV